ncbi:hypothetical protein K1719_034818 [Acacia pycnantha]|nr:hypothetical protein K1719_034818 [Acacia pycnantha]
MSFKDAVVAQGLKSYDLGGVGLGIVVALIKFGIVLKSAVCSTGLTRSKPILVRSIKNPADRFHEGVNEMEFGSLEDHTYATCRLPNCCSKYLRIGISQGLEYV